MPFESIIFSSTLNKPPQSPINTDEDDTASMIAIDENDDLEKIEGEPEDKKRKHDKISNEKVKLDMNEVLQKETHFFYSHIKTKKQELRPSLL